MKLFFLLLNVAFLGACYATEKGKNANEPSLGINTKLTQAASTKTANEQVSSTEKITTETQIKGETIEIPATFENSQKRLGVTDFITKNGDNYEIENKNIVGKIQPRQVQISGEYICNYGSLAIYSDVPCKQVNSKLRAGEVVEAAALEETSSAFTQQESKPAEGDINRATTNKPDSPIKNVQKRPNKNAHKRPSQSGRPNQKPQKRPNQNTQKRPNKNGHKRPNPNGQKRPNKNGHKRPNQNGQKRPNKNKQNRPNQNAAKRPNKTNSKRTANNGQKRPPSAANNKNKGRPSQHTNDRRWEEADYTGSDESFSSNQRRHIQDQRYISYYDDSE